MKITVYVDGHRCKESDAHAEVQMLQALIPCARITLVRGMAWADELAFADAVYRHNEVLVVFFY